MIGLLKSRLLFFFPLMIAWIIMAAASLSGVGISKVADHVHSFGLNVFFINYTFMADGIFVLVALAVYYIYFKKRKESLSLLFTFLFCEIIVQAIKNMHDLQGLQFYFESGQYLFTNKSEFQQPFFSGHTAVAFSMITMMVFDCSNKMTQFLLLPAGLLMAYSRIYLGLHSLQDVMLASFVGSITALLSFYVLNYPFAENTIDKKLKAGNILPPVRMQPA
ncbi:MAG: phosphatase PAP2 family protein [Bacteroidetes bacterium]|nr:phosphatase PAP2 family protein [Bacteroidota bacterium]